MRILFFGTHPKQFNGYSKVVYEISKCMSKIPNVDFSIYGFQNFYDNNGNHRNDIPNNVIVYDAFANESPKQIGFGVQQVKDFVRLNNPDVCVVYNDMLVVSQIITQLRAVENYKYKIIGYVDQVYLHQRKEFIDYINKNMDAAILFTKHWEEVIVKQGVTIPTHHLEHGFNPMSYYPIPREIARTYFGVKPDDFIILNLNRNQPRKRWDICLKAFAEIVSRHPDEPIKMMIATAVTGAWNLLEIFERELQKRSLTLELGMKHLILLDNPQRISDEETNILYNIADIGINTCDGEGFGLCNFEQGGIGIPQIVPRFGGFIDFFNDDNAMLMDPKMAYYVDTTRDMVCGEALLCDYMDFVEAVEAYYNSKELRGKHGAAARKRVIEGYSWDRIAHKLSDICRQVVGIQDQPSVQSLMNEVEQVDQSTLQNIVRTKIPVVVEDEDEEKPKESKKGKKNKREEMLKLKKQLELLLAEDDSDDE